MEYWKDNHFTAKFSAIPEALRAKGEWGGLNKKDLSEVEYIILWHHKTKDKTFGNLPDAPNLKYLEINWSGSTSLKGLEKYKNLKRLELHYCTKITTIADVCALKDSLESFHVNVSKKIQDHEKVTCCKKMSVLRFNDCGTIKNLNFLYKMENLEEFRFVDTNVIGGDLLPLIKHPGIKRVGFLNKRHYSHKDNEIDDILMKKPVNKASQKKVTDLFIGVNKVFRK